MTNANMAGGAPADVGVILRAQAAELDGDQQSRVSGTRSSRAVPPVTWWARDFPGGTDQAREARHCARSRRSRPGLIASMLSCPAWRRRSTSSPPPSAFTVPVRPSYIFWLGCVEKGGFAVIQSPVLGLDTEMPCGGNERVSGYQLDAAVASAGREATVRVTAPWIARWEFRIDSAPKAS